MTSKKTAAARARRNRAASPLVRALKWGAAVAVIGFVLFAFSENAGVAYDEDDIRVVDFSSLSDSAKRDALRTANRERCTCGCGMTLAQCVSTDMTCPIRDRNVETIRQMVRDRR